MQKIKILFFLICMAAVWVDVAGAAGTRQNSIWGNYAQQRAHICGGSGNAYNIDRPRIVFSKIG